MSLVYSTSRSGLVLATEAQDERAIQAALKRMDDRLMLDRDVDRSWQRTVYRVLVRVGTDLPPRRVCEWRDQQTGEPLPLSFALVERVGSLHVESRAPKDDADAHNARLQAEAEALTEEAAAYYANELVPRLKGLRSSVLPRGAHRRKTAFRDVTDIR